MSGTENVAQAGEDRLLSVKEVAEYLRISPQSIYNKINAGLLEYSKIGARVLIRKSVLDALLEAGTVKARVSQGRN